MLHTLIGTHRSNAVAELNSWGWDWSGTLDSRDSDNPTYWNNATPGIALTLTMASDHVTVESVTLSAR